MFTIGVNPVAFTIGSLSVRWYGIMVALAVVALLVVTIREGKRLGISQDVVYTSFIAGTIGGVVGARLFHVVDYWEFYSHHVSEIIGFAGLALYGAVIGAVLAVVLYLWRIKYLWGKAVLIVDAVAVGAPLAQAIGRVGCTINGCCYGLPTSLPWAVVYTNPDSFCGSLGVPIHPTQIYFLLWNLVVFSVVWFMRDRLKPHGSLFLLYLSLYAVGDFSLRFFRVNDIFLFGLQEGQVISLAILVVAVPWLIVRMRRFRRKNSVDEVDGDVNQAHETGQNLVD